MIPIGGPYRNHEPLPTLHRSRVNTVRDALNMLYTQTVDHGGSRGPVLIASGAFILAALEIADAFRDIAGAIRDHGEHGR